MSLQRVKFGVNLLLLCDSVTPAVLRQFPRIREMGFDGVEVPIFAPETIDVDRIRSVAGTCGLALTTCGALPPKARFYGDDRAARNAAANYLRGCIRAIKDLGASLMCGPLYKAVGDTDESAPLAVQRQQTATAMMPLIAEAAAAGVTFAFEPLNRFETNFMNTVAQGIEFCTQLKSPSATLLLDTFHMHIEEKNSADAVAAAARAGVLAHFHASENDRGIAGTGQVRWHDTAGALRRAQYAGWVVLESFAQTNKAIRTAVSCWRPFYPSAEEFLAKGLRFARKTFR